MKDPLLDKKENILTIQHNSVLKFKNEEISYVDKSQNETDSTTCGKFHKEVSYR
jgi:hypothetical protein